MTDVAVAVAQVAAGGGIVQAILALTRRRSELRRLDRDTDSVAVETADQVMGILRRELLAAKDELLAARQAMDQLQAGHAQAIAQQKATQATERREHQRQLQGLVEQVSDLRDELRTAKAQINRMG
jgi:non-homologous end joining protein Ku